MRLICFRYPRHPNGARQKLVSWNPRGVPSLQSRVAKRAFEAGDLALWSHCFGSAVCRLFQEDFVTQPFGFVGLYLPVDLRTGAELSRYLRRGRGQARPPRRDYLGRCLFTVVEIEEGGAGRVKDASNVGESNSMACSQRLC